MEQGNVQGFEPKYMRRAIELAERGLGAVNPNPLVGAVIVKDGCIIGEGYHERYGQLHAERAAFASLAAPSDAKGADMYVTLEPCCHHGKQPPCVDAIIEHGIGRIFCGSDDPNEKVSGKGFEILRKAGIQVYTHCLKEECDKINDIFFKYITTKRPYVTMKYAMTMDGKIATCTGKSKWITGDLARAYVMELRNKHKGIMVGIGTVLADDPMLSCRIPDGQCRQCDNARNPVRIVCDSRLRIPLDSALVKTAGDIPVIVATTKEGVENSDKASELMSRGVTVVVTEEQDGHVDLSELMDKLGEMEIDGILLEGGSRLNYSMLEKGLVDEAITFIAPKVFGGEGIYTPVAGEGIHQVDEAYMFRFDESQMFGQDIMLRYKKRQ